MSSIIIVSILGCDRKHAASHPCSLLPSFHPIFLLFFFLCCIVLQLPSSVIADNFLCTGGGCDPCSCGGGTLPSCGGCSNALVPWQSGSRIYNCYPDCNPMVTFGCSSRGLSMFKCDLCPCGGPNFPRCNQCKKEFLIEILVPCLGGPALFAFLYFCGVPMMRGARCPRPFHSIYLACRTCRGRWCVNGRVAIYNTQVVDSLVVDQSKSKPNHIFGGGRKILRLQLRPYKDLSFSLPPASTNRTSVSSSFVTEDQSSRTVHPLMDIRLDETLASVQALALTPLLQMRCHTQCKELMDHQQALKKMKCLFPVTFISGDDILMLPGVYIRQIHAYTPVGSWPWANEDADAADTETSRNGNKKLSYGTPCVNDRVLSIQGTSVSSIRQAEEIIFSMPPGMMIHMTLERRMVRDPMPPPQSPQRTPQIRQTGSSVNLNLYQSSRRIGSSVAMSSSGGSGGESSSMIRVDESKEVEVFEVHVQMEAEGVLLSDIHHKCRRVNEILADLQNIKDEAEKPQADNETAGIQRTLQAAALCKTQIVVPAEFYRPKQQLEVQPVEVEVSNAIVMSHGTAIDSSSSTEPIFRNMLGTNISAALPEQPPETLVDL